MKRAAVCVGVNNAGSLGALDGAAVGAQEFAAWARKREAANIDITIRQIS